jgi:cytochrome c biogenesis protein CcmG/thiol:disulfide interchange protein DsbE
MKKLFLAAVLALSSTSAFAISPFELPWVNNPARDTIYKTSDHANGVFVLEFFANFCGACNENAPNVDALAEHYADEPRVLVLDMAIDTNDREIAAWIARHQPNHPVLKDVGRAVWREVATQYIPTVVITDCNGVEKYRYTGAWTSSVKATIKSKIDALLAETCE